MKKIILKNLALFSTISLFMLTLASCKKDFLNLTPTESISDSEAFDSEAKLQAVMTGIYDRLSASDYLHNIILNGDAKGEDVFPNSTGNYNRFVAGYQYIESVNNSELERHWAIGYEVIANCNLVIQNVPNSPISDALKNRFIAEASAIRAFVHFQLVQEFGAKPYVIDPNALGVPVVLKPIGPADEFPARASVQAVYKSITDDLTFAEANFPPSVDNVYRINLYTIKAIAARVYLTMGQWQKAKDLATEVSDAYTLALGSELLTGFRSPTSEWIWAINSRADDNSFYLEVSSFYDPYDQGYSSFRANIDFFSQFDDNDIRKNQFRIPDVPGTDPTTGEYIKFGDGNLTSKFVFDGSGANDQVLFRASEMVLTAAEASARLGGALNELDARNNLFKIQSRANPAALISLNTGNALVQEILLERRKELYGEGQRYYDILRTKQNLVRTGPSHWSLLNISSGDKRFALPIPQKEINANPLIVPNPL